MIEEKDLEAIKFGPFNLVMHLKKEVQKSLYTQYYLLNKCRNGLIVLILEIFSIVIMLFGIRMESTDPAFKFFSIVLCALLATAAMLFVKGVCYIFEFKKSIREDKELLKIIYIRELKEKKDESNLVEND